ncbi:MAG: Ig-like domain-containing protein, partial [Bacteroidota bacterium]
MKLLYKVLFVTFFTSLSFAQSLDGVKICIDPGHGGHEGDDRHIEEADFWESEGNFYKALHLKEILDSLGATVILTRYGNGDSGADDPGLSVRAGIANANDVDLFQSIHSNAYNGTRNFTLMLYHGYDNTPTFADAKSYALKAYQNFEKVNHVEDLSWDNIRGDFSFYGNTSGLGVLRPLTMPGILSEGSFHDYLPEAWRLKNSEYLRHEAWAITRAMLEHFDGGTYSTGNIAGILRDPLVNVPSSYKPRADLGDAKKPLNNVRAVIQPGNLEYNGDDQNNGYFLFEDLTPGDYTVYLEAEDYALDSATVTVTANNSSFIYKNLSLVPNENHPTITLTKPYNGEVEASNAGYIEINFDIRMDEAITESAFSITPAVSGDFTWENNQKTLIFKSNGNLTPGETYAISVDTTAKTIFDKNLQSEYSFNFTTRSKLNLVSNYPADREINISKSVQVRLQFDHAINGATLGGGTIQFLDSEGNFVNLIVENSLYAKGMIAFTPRDSLETGELYRVVLGEGIGDTEGVTFQQNIELSFVAENYVISTGNLVDDFEINNYWEDPFENPNSIGINESSGFRIVTNVKKNGSSSAELQYSFNELSGYYKVSKSIPASIGESSNVE